MWFVFSGTEMTPICGPKKLICTERLLGKFYLGNTAEKVTINFQYIC